MKVIHKTLDGLGDIVEAKNSDHAWKDDFIRLIDDNKDNFKDYHLIDSKRIGTILKLTEEFLDSKDSSWVTGFLDFLYSVGLLREQTLIRHKCDKILAKLDEIRERLDVNQGHLNTL